MPTIGFKTEPLASLEFCVDLFAASGEPKRAPAGIPGAM